MAHNEQRPAVGAGRAENSRNGLEAANLDYLAAPLQPITAPALRSYRREVIANVEAEVERGNRRALIVAPTSREEANGN